MAAVAPLDAWAGNGSLQNAAGAVLANCVLAPDLLNDLDLDPRHFRYKHQQRIFETLLAMHAEGAAIDAITVAERLEEAGDPNGEKGYLFSCISEAIVSREGTPGWAKMLRDAAEAESLWTGVQRALERRDETLVVRLAEAIQTRQVPGSRRAVQATVDVAFQSMVDEWDESKHRPKLTWGIDRLERQIKPLEPTRFYVIGARPGMGKTAFALQVAAANARLGRTVGFISLEQSMEELTARLICNESQCAMDWIRGEEGVPPNEVGRIDEAKKRIRDWPLIINDATPMTIAQLTGWARSLVQRHKVELLIVDYVQKIRGAGNKSQIEIVNEAAMGLKDIARVHKVPVLALGQIKRDAEDRRPTMADFKDSGVIEQEADQALALYRERDEDGKRKSDCEVIVLKNRHGIADVKVTTFYRGECFRFEDRDDRYTEDMYR